MTEKHKKLIAAQIRVIVFLFAMAPLLLAAMLVGLVPLVLSSPVIVYALITGKHMKDPFRSNTLLR